MSAMAASAVSLPSVVLAASSGLADTIADWMSVFVLVALPPAGIYLFWMLHILPEKVAIQRQHPQKDAIHALCLLSLFFGGLLWPIAMLWAYIKPTGFRVAVVEPDHLHGVPAKPAVESGPLADDSADDPHSSSKAV